MIILRLGKTPTHALFCPKLPKRYANVFKREHNSNIAGSEVNLDNFLNCKPFRDFSQLVDSTRAVSPWKPFWCLDFEFKK